EVRRVEGPRHNQRRRGNSMLLAIACIAMALPTTLFAVGQSDDAVAMGAAVSDSAVVRDVVARVEAGDFAGAEAAIAAALADAPATDREVLAYQRERMRRIRMDFTLDAEAAKERIRRQVPDLTDAEFARWDAEGLLERMDIDGQRL